MAVNPMQKKSNNSGFDSSVSNTFNNRSSYSLINDEGGKSK